MATTCGSITVHFESCVGNSVIVPSSSDSVSVADALNLGDADQFSSLTVAELKQRLKDKGSYEGRVRNSSWLTG